MPGWLTAILAAVVQSFLRMLLEDAKKSVAASLKEKGLRADDETVTKLAVERLRSTVEFLPAGTSSKTPEQVDKEGEDSFDEFFKDIHRR